jgi:hypothetical protein
VDANYILSIINKETTPTIVLLLRTEPKSQSKCTSTRISIYQSIYIDEEIDIEEEALATLIMMMTKKKTNDPFLSFFLYIDNIREAMLGNASQQQQQQLQKLSNLYI